MKKVLALSIVAVLATASQAALFTVGYDAGDLGTNMIVDGALSASLAPTGGEMRDDEGDPAWATVWNGLWNVGDTVEITGIALNDVRSPNTGDTTNNTSNGTFTFTFYELNGGSTGGYDGTNNGETILTTRDVIFQDEGAGADISVYALFDTPVTFTAQSSGIAVAIDSTSSLRLRNTTVAPVNGEGFAYNENNGNLWGGTEKGMLWSLSGTVVPEPATMMLLGLGSLIALNRRK